MFPAEFMYHLYMNTFSTFCQGFEPTCGLSERLKEGGKEENPLREVGDLLLKMEGFIDRRYLKPPLRDR